MLEWVAIVGGLEWRRSNAELSSDRFVSQNHSKRADWFGMLILVSVGNREEQGQVAFARGRLNAFMPVMNRRRNQTSIYGSVRIFLLRERPLQWQ